MENNVILITYFDSPAGELILGSYGERLCLCDWRNRKMRDSIDGRIQKILGCAYRNGGSAVTEQAVTELNEYFAGKRRDFSVSIQTAGTVFQKKIWDLLLTVPYGTTTTYGALAKKAGNAAAVRAVAAANGANALSIFIPCHRIIASGGTGGYAGGITAKRKLLALENAVLHQK
ncbi:MAG: methylated-DNA--[protein]-cysteine S-methyltransferase [Spirochaetales bacterium]|nr:methylated-DNA--[protein]-cysteine S-methyltransferase [Spirochaetales bacterium]